MVQIFIAIFLSPPPLHVYETEMRERGRKKERIGFEPFYILKNLDFPECPLYIPPPFSAS